MTNSPPPSRAPDSAAVVFSAICVLHCVVLPIVAVSVPFVSVLADAEWVHWTMAGLAVAASSSVALFGSDARVARFLVPATLGCALIVGGLFAENYGIEETIPTVIGGGLLIVAHVRRLFSRPA